MGAEKVYILYRRDAEHMPARELELKEAVEDGIEIMCTTQAVKAKLKNGRVAGIECRKTNVNYDNVIDVEGSEFFMKADTIIFAIGLLPDRQILTAAGIKLDRDLIDVDENKMTNIDGVFAGGDLVEARSYVCKSIESGKTAAKSMEKYLLG